MLFSLLFLFERLLFLDWLSLLLDPFRVWPPSKLITILRVQGYGIDSLDEYFLREVLSDPYAFCWDFFLEKTVNSTLFLVFERLFSCISSELLKHVLFELFLLRLWTSKIFLGLLVYLSSLLLMLFLDNLSSASVFSLLSYFILGLTSLMRLGSDICNGSFLIGDVLIRIILSYWLSISVWHLTLTFHFFFVPLLTFEC